MDIARNQMSRSSIAMMRGLGVSVSDPLTILHKEVCGIDPATELSAYQSALNHVAIVATTDSSGRIAAVNDLFCAISQYSREELIGNDHRILNSGHHPSSFFHNMWLTVSSGQVWRADICNRSKSGRLYWVDTTIAPWRDSQDCIGGYISIRFDITARKNAEALLLQENRKRQEVEDLLSDIVDTVPSGIVAYDQGGKVVFYNKAHKQFYGLLAPMIDIGSHYRDITQYGLDNGQFELPKDSAAARSLWAATRIAEHEMPGRPYIERLSPGRWVQVQNRKSSSGNLVSVQTDVTELKRAERQIKEQAERDALTGLANRRVLLERLSRVLQSDDRKARSGALVVVDLDDFKAVNDRFGHDGGDALLQQVGERLKASVRKTDTVARLGGDEFAILLQNISNEREVAAILEKLLHTMKRPIGLGQQVLMASASLGVAMIPRDGRTPQDLIKNADLALYQAKLRGRRTYTIYNASMRRERKRRAMLLEKLRGALERNEIEVALQPQLDIATGRHSGFEALVRWRVGRKDIPPPELISIAEEAGLVAELGHQVISRSLSIMNRMKNASLEPGTIAFNVVAAQLRDPDFAEQFLALLSLHDVRPDEIEIEVTENVILDRSAGNLIGVLRDLHHRGVCISLDDFGTGYASLTHLKRFPINRLKIDRSFVSGILDRKDDEVIVRTIISLAHSLGLNVVAEGVEHEDQYKQLSNFGCDYVQGYHIAKPLNEGDALSYLRWHRADNSSAIFTATVQLSKSNSAKYSS